MHHLISTLAVPALRQGSELWWTGARHIVDNPCPTYHRLAMAATNLPPWPPTDLLLCEVAMPPLNLLFDHTSRKHEIRMLQGADSHLNKLTQTQAIQSTIKKGLSLRRIAHLIQVTVMAKSRLEDTKDPIYHFDLTAIHIPSGDKKEAAQSHTSCLRHTADVMALF